MLNYIFTHRAEKSEGKKTLQPKSERCIIKVRKLEDIVKEGHKSEVNETPPEILPDLYRIFKVKTGMRSDAHLKKVYEVDFC